MSVWTDFFAPPPGNDPTLALGPGEFKGALVTKSGTQSIANVTNVDVTWQTATYDTDSFFSGGDPTKLIVPEGVTRVKLSGVISWDSTTAQNKRQVIILKNNAAFDGGGQNIRNVPNAFNDAWRQPVVSAIVDVVEGDFFEINVRQTSGGTRSIQTTSWFAIEVIEGIAPVLATGVAPFKGALARRSTNLGGFATGTTTDITWNSVDYDTDGFFDLGSDARLITIPAGITRARIFAQINADANSNGDRQYIIRQVSPGSFIVGETVLDGVEVGGVPTVAPIFTPIMDVAEGETYKIDFGHNSGSTRSVQGSSTSLFSYFGIEVIEAIAINSGVSRGALVNQATSFSLTNNVTTTVTWNNEIYDTDNIHSNVTDNSRLTVPASVTHVRLSGSYVDNSNTSGWRFLQLRKNGGSVPGLTNQSSPASGSNTHFMSLSSPVLEVVEGDYFEMQIFQNSGSTRSVSGDIFWFAMEIVEPALLTTSDPAQVVQTLIDGANISWNQNTSRTAQVTLAGNRTLDNPTNSIEGLEYTLKIIQDATGSRTLAYGSAYKFAGGTPPTLTATANAVDVLRFWFDGTDYIKIGFEANVS